MTFELHLRAIFDDMRDCAEQIIADRSAFLKRFPFAPPTISVGDGRTIYVSEKTVLAVREIARKYRENSAECRRALPHHEMAELASFAIGSIISKSAPNGATEFPIPDDPNAFWVALRTQLTLDLTKLDRELTHLFGAWVIQGDTIKFVDIGPVRFSLRAQWVSDAVAAGVLTESQAPFLVRLWCIPGPNHCREAAIWMSLAAGHGLSTPSYWRR
jgi:hypothetical protein